MQMKCQVCGAENQVSARFCRCCGSQMVQVPAQQAVPFGPQGAQPAPQSLMQAQPAPKKNEVGLIGFIVAVVALAFNMLAWVLCQFEVLGPILTTSGIAAVLDIVALVLCIIGIRANSYKVLAIIGVIYSSIRMAYYFSILLFLLMYIGAIAELFIRVIAHAAN